MARPIHKLNDLQVKRSVPGDVLGDGGGLWLVVRPSRTPRGTPSRAWVFAHRSPTLRRDREMGLGALPAVTLAKARARARGYREQLAEGLDPLQERERQEKQEKAAAASQITFKAAALEYIEANKAGWSNAKHADQWRNTLETHAFPLIGDKPVAAIDTEAVLNVLRPLWSTKTETASRLRLRIEAIIDRVIADTVAKGGHAWLNPAKWRGHLRKNYLPIPSKIRPVKHFAALDYRQIGAFVGDLKQRAGTAARAFEFLILCASRTSEVIGARWSEIEADGMVWTIPADRIKARRLHRVPLCARAREILAEMREAHKLDPSNPYIFPGDRRGRGLSTGAFLMLLERMDHGHVTAHGMRASFRTWGADRTAFTSDVCEAALAHATGDKTLDAYQRGELFDKRARLMDEWAAYIEQPPTVGNVVTMRGASA